VGGKIGKYWARRMCLGLFGIAVHILKCGANSESNGPAEWAQVCLIRVVRY